MHRFVLLTIDVVLVALATCLALFLRDNLEFSPEKFEAALPYVFITGLIAAVVLPSAGLDRTLWRFSSLADYMRVVLAVVAIVVLSMAACFAFNRLDGVARSLPVLQGLLMVGLLIGARVATRLRHARRGRKAPIESGGMQFDARETVLVVGLNALAELYLRSAEELAAERVHVVGLLGRAERHRDRLLRQYPVLGLPEEVDLVLAKLEVHGVVVSRIVVASRFEELSQAAQAALLRLEKNSDVELDLLAERMIFNADRSKVQSRGGTASNADERLAALDLQKLGTQPYFRWKRTIDVAIAALAIACLAPVFVVVGLLVAVDVGTPLFFWQQRPGWKGRPLRIYKFRSMAAAHDANGRRLPDSLRLSPIGSLLRRSRLDELPQLLNILMGDMSFVGPRPLLPIDQSVDFAARLAVRPGLTGWAQVKGGREISATDKAMLDIWYIRHASLGLDVRIVLETARMVVAGERIDERALLAARRDLSAIM